MVAFDGNSMLSVATFGPQGPNFTCKSFDCIHSSRPKEAQVLEFKALLFLRVADFRHYGENEPYWQFEINQP
jgi:hypothetical protein